MASNSDDKIRSSDQRMGSTRWSVVLAAGQGSSPGSRQALETLCQIYWYPLYAYSRRRGCDAHTAQDLTQEFFVRLLENDVVEAADPSRGKFRTFLLTSLRNFLTNQWDKQEAQKRGGGQHSIRLDFAAGDSRYDQEPADDLTPERLYEKQWATTLLDHVMTQLREEFERAGKQTQFEQLKAFLGGRSSTTSYAAAASALGISEQAAMTAASRMRKRYRALLHAEIAQTLADPADVQEEFRDLFAILSS